MDLRGNAKRRNVGVLFAELRNFTRLSDTLDPDKVIELANVFFDFAARQLTAHRGQAVAVLNDAVFGVFEAAADTVTAAKEMQRDFRSIRDRWQNDHGLSAAVALGGHLGEAVLGKAGSSGFGQQVAFGDCIGLAQRLLYRARAGEIILSAELVQATGVFPAALGATRLPPLELWQRQPVAIYGILLDSRLDLK